MERGVAASKQRKAKRESGGGKQDNVQEKCRENSPIQLAQAAKVLAISAAAAAAAALRQRSEGLLALRQGLADVAFMLHSLLKVRSPLLQNSTTGPHRQGWGEL